MKIGQNLAKLCRHTATAGLRAEQSAATALLRLYRCTGTTLNINLLLAGNDKGDLSVKKVCAVPSVLLLIFPSYAKSTGEKIENRSAFGEVRHKSKVPPF